jgi:hypothetical protein
MLTDTTLTDIPTDNALPSVKFIIREKKNKQSQNPINKSSSTPDEPKKYVCRRKTRRRIHLLCRINRKK